MAAENQMAWENENGGIGDRNIEEKDCFTVEVLYIIKEAQQQHGLRHGDYQRYRQYCARRLKRVRKSLHFPQGTRNKVQPKKLTEEMLKDSKFLFIPLFDAERAWSYAMQLKEEANTEPRKKFHLVSRMRKAVDHSESLVTLCESDKCDARTKLEAQAYNAFLKGSLHFEQERWKTAIEHFSKAQTIYEKLASAFVDEMKEVYTQRVEEISPNIRYCAYNIGDETAIKDLMQMRMKSSMLAGDTHITRLDELIEKTREKQSATFSEVTWRGRTVPVKSEQVRVSLLTVHDTEKQLSESSNEESKLSVYETLLKELIDAQQALKEDLRDDQTFRAIQKGQDYDGKVPNSIYLHTYLCYLRQTKTIERNLLMIDSLKKNLPGSRQDDSKKLTKPQDLARLYEIIIQNLSEISSLPGLEDDGTLKEEIEANIKGYKAFRCYYISLTYLQGKKWKESIALLERTSEYCQDAIQAYKHVKSKEKELPSLEALMLDIDGQKYSCHASSVLTTDQLTDPNSALSAADKKKPLVDRLDAYYEDKTLSSKKPNLVSFPPDFEPIPSKPVFFDLANSLVEFPSLEDRAEQKKQGGGLGGLVKGWLSWGSKK